MVDVAKATVRYEGDLSNLESANRKAEASVKQTAASIDKSTEKISGGIGKLGEKAIKVFAALGAVEAGLKATDAVLKVFTGDLAGATEALKTLPFGIGPAIGALETLLGKITGVNAELAAAAERTKELTEEGKRLDQATAILQKIEGERARLGRSPEEIAAINIREETEKQVKALQDLGRTEREIALARELGARKLLAIERAQRDERKQEMAAALGTGGAEQTSISGFQAASATGDPGARQALLELVSLTKRLVDQERLS